jgi:hypothetical protein
MLARRATSLRQHVRPIAFGNALGSSLAEAASSPSQTQPSASASGSGASGNWDMGPTDYSLASGGPVRLGTGSVEPAVEPFVDSDNYDLMGTPRQVGVVGKDGARGAWGIAQSLAGEGASNAEVNRVKNQVLALNPELADGVQKGQRYYVPDASTPENLALARSADRQYQADLAARSQPSVVAWGDGLSFGGDGTSFAEMALGGGSSSLGASTSLGGWQRTQAHALGVYDAGAGAVESAGYSFGVVGTPESRAAWAVKTAEATVEGIRRFANDPGGTVSGWWDNLTGDDPAAIRQATAQGAGIAMGVGGGIVMGRLGSGGLASTGARSLSLAEFERQLAAADRAYGEIRLNTTDVQSIAQNTGLKEFQVARVKNHLFLDDTHQLSTRVGQFDADFDIASAWRRMEAGTHTFDDIKLFKHEYFESKFEKIFRTNYENAHNAAQKRYPSPLVD